VQGGPAMPIGGLGFRFVSSFLSFSISNFLDSSLFNLFFYFCLSSFLLKKKKKNGSNRVVVGLTRLRPEFDYNKPKPYFPVSGSRVVSKIVNPSHKYVINGLMSHKHVIKQVGGS
jgi:cell shape-determining protein MreC